jgi:uncharacterized protein GlcG (DUF336 family)
MGLKKRVKKNNVPDRLKNENDKRRKHENAEKKAMDVPGFPKTPRTNDLESRQEIALSRIVNEAFRVARRVPSEIRFQEEDPFKTKSKIHVSVWGVDVVTGLPFEAVPTSRSVGAWPLSEDVAYRKAFSAVAFSSRENALSTRGIGMLSQPGQPLWGIQSANATEAHGFPSPVSFPGGLPLYLDGDVLIGGIGISGDAPDIDELIAYNAALRSNLLPRSEIRNPPFTDIRKHVSEGPMKGGEIEKLQAKGPTIAMRFPAHRGLDPVTIPVPREVLERLRPMSTLRELLDLVPGEFLSDGWNFDEGGDDDLYALMWGDMSRGIVSFGATGGLLTSMFDDVRNIARAITGIDGEEDIESEGSGEGLF